MSAIPPAVLTVRVTEYGVRRILEIEQAHEYPGGLVPAAREGVGCFVELSGFAYGHANVVTPWHPPGATPPSAAEAIARSAYAFVCEGVRGRA